jgi:hypothetical protein
MGRWPLLHDRDYMLLLGGELLSELGSQVSAVAYPLLVLALTGSPGKAGVVALAKWLPPVVFAVPAGALAEHPSQYIRGELLVDDTRADLVTESSSPQRSRGEA